MDNTPRLGLRLLEGTDVANYELINTILLLIDENVAMQGALAAATGHNHSGADGSGPKIPYANLSGAPVALPANGGNADTLDNKHASDFSPSTHSHAAATQTLDGFLSKLDKVALDLLASRVDQALKSTSSPTFNVVTASKVIGGVYA
jgi:hypothetical protein